MRTPLVATLALGLLCSGCQTIHNSPKVDFAATTTPQAIPSIYAEASGPATGSLFSASKYRPAFEDRRPRMVGDTLTIQIVENVSASQTSTSTIDRKDSLASSVTTLPFMGTGLAGKLGVGADSSNAFSGKGGTSSANTFTGSITATVVQVLPNGHLVVAGEKQIGVNENVDVLRFTGTVDPRAVQPGSVVSSAQVANTRIESKGRGAQGEAQALGWLSRFFLNVLPF